MSKIHVYFNTSTVLRIYLVLSLTLIGVLLLICRNPDPFIHPIIYAEDGDWSGLGLTYGWFYPLFHARPDYLVMGNVMLLWIASQCCLVLFGNPIECLPQSIAIISCLFYSTIAVVAFYCTKGIIPLMFRGALFLLLLLVPMGLSQNEIIGRIVQAGHYITLLAIMLFYFKSNCNKFILRSIIDFFLIICAMTNPLIIGLGLCYFIWDVKKNSNILNAFVRNAVLNISLLVLLIYMVPRIMSDHTNRLQGLFDAGNLVEAIGARSILFPMVFPWYHTLSNVFTIFLLTAWILLLIYCYLTSKEFQNKKIMLFVFFGLIITVIATILMRPALTTGFHQYQTTCLNRYFFGINALSIFLTVISLGSLASSTKKIPMLLGGMGLGIIAAIYLFHLPLLFEIHASRWPLMDKLTFKEQVNSVQLMPHSVSTDVPIYPVTWTMQIPTKWVKMLQNEKPTQ